jgi:hypothetical protein
LFTIYSLPKIRQRLYPLELQTRLFVNYSKNKKFILDMQ